METLIQPKILKGFRDFLPEAEIQRSLLIEKLTKTFRSYGFVPIDTPVLEYSEILLRKSNGETEKQVFRFEDNGKRDVAMRFDLTVPLARFYANNREKLPTPFKAIQIDYSFRAERPQRGRLRQFTQCDIDVFGDKTINAELELLKTAIDTYESLGFNSLTLKINNRQILNQLVLFAGFNESDINTVCVTLDKIDKISVSGVVMELLDKGFAAENINMLVEEINDVLANGINTVSNSSAVSLK